MSRSVEIAYRALTFGNMGIFCDGSATTAQIFSVFVPVDVAVGKNVLSNYMHGLTCGDACDLAVLWGGGN